jgi:hypothetical protein
MQCEICGLNYSEMRTHMTYREVYHLIYTRPHKRRHGVLGYWHELKLKQWAAHLDECAYYAAQAAAQAPELSIHAS